jgi:acyl carrier protein
MDKSAIIDLIRDILRKDLDLGLQDKAIAIDDSLGADGLALDSVTMAEFINALEARFDIRILDEDLDGANFVTVGSVADLVLLRAEGTVAT